MACLATADQRVTAESDLTRYLEEIRRVPMLEPQDEYMLAKRWREHDDLEAAHKLVSSHLRLVTRIATGYFEKVQKSVKNGVAVMETSAPLPVHELRTLSSGGKTADGRVAMSALYGKRMRREGDRSSIKAPKFASYP